MLDPPETDAATKEREELLKVLAELAGRLEHELKDVNRRILTLIVYYMCRHS